MLCSLGGFSCLRRICVILVLQRSSRSSTWPGWSKPVGTVSLDFSDGETNIVDVWVSGEEELCKLSELEKSETGGTWGSDLGNYGVCGAEISFSNKRFFSEVCRLRKFLMYLSMKVLGIRRPEERVSVLVRSLCAMSFHTFFSHFLNTLPQFLCILKTS